MVNVLYQRLILRGEFMTPCPRIFMDSQIFFSKLLIESMDFWLVNSQNILTKIYPEIP